MLVRDRLERGDMVVAIHPEQGPVMHYYLPQDIGLRWADALGPVKDPQIFDWRDALDRLKAARPTPTEDALVRTLQAGPAAAAVFPIIRTARWGAPWTSEVRKRSAQWQRVLDRDKRLSRTLVVARCSRASRCPRACARSSTSALTPPLRSVSND